ncbi:glycosyl hydrolase family 18 protein [Chitinophaga sp. sic0106]|uniref:glycosyl hydrolase family 18 protein n=1 Tax=Chitinophaga sp. sic0106 TaxID=2854785 RepID=UPI001C476FB4|nr:glycosyl hydrolase family 18 protein [Chitinophaga sp. sic0106]MBV7529677.1 hypothetical protein [Chitinophaga sp. sic0106]
MKKQLHICFLLAAGLLAGCTKDEAADQAAGKPFTPRVFNEISLFPESRDSIRILNVGDTMAFTGLQYSPVQADIAWKINDSVAATDKQYYFIAREGGAFRVSVNVTYQGYTTSRYRDIFVIPNTYKPKAAANVVMAYISDTASYKQVDFSAMTHMAYKVATITAAGTMDISKGEIARKAEETVGRAHVAGVPVLLGISGALSADGWSVSQSNQFGAVITDVAKRAALVQSIKAYVAAKRMDGVDLLMTDINASASIINANIAATGTLLTELRAALGANAILTATVAGSTYYDRYPDLSAANWINVHAYEDGVHVGPGKPLGQPSGFDYFVQCAGLWKSKYPAAKIVMGIPAFGLRYNSLDANGNNLSWTSYNYIPYKEILAAVPAAATKEYAEIAKGVYFNGIPLATQKAAWLKQNGFLGAYLWAGEYDVTGQQSLTANVYNSLQ